MRLIIIIGLIAAFVASSLEGRSQFREEYTGGPVLSKSVYIYPNPATESTDYVNIKVAPFKAQSVKLTLHNIIGNKLSVETEIVDEHELRIRIKDLAAGYYLLGVQDQDSNFRGTYKILKR